MKESVFVDSSNTFPFPLLLLLELELELLLLNHCFEVDEWSDPGLVCESDPGQDPNPGPKLDHAWSVWSAVSMVPGTM